MPGKIDHAPFKGITNKQILKLNDWVENKDIRRLKKYKSPINIMKRLGIGKSVYYKLKSEGRVGLITELKLDQLLELIKMYNEDMSAPKEEVDNVDKRINKSDQKNANSEEKSKKLREEAIKSNF